jgi:hypothetical protein
LKTKKQYKAIARWISKGNLRLVIELEDRKKELTGDGLARVSQG